MKRERLKALFAEYGRVAIWTYLGLFLVVLAGFAMAITAGVSVKSAEGGAGLLGAAWLATKLTQPLRIGATLALTPVVAAVLKKLRRKKDEVPARRLGPESERETPST